MIAGVSYCWCYRPERSISGIIPRNTAMSGTVSGVVIADMTPSIVTPSMELGVLGNINIVVFLLGATVIASVMITKEPRVHVIERIPGIKE